MCWLHEADLRYEYGEIVKAEELLDRLYASNTPEVLRSQGRLRALQIAVSEKNHERSHEILFSTNWNNDFMPDIAALSFAALDVGEPLPLIGEAVFARCLSALKPDREKASEWLVGPKTGIDAEQEDFVAEVKEALYGSKIISYAQGFQLIQQTSKDKEWNIDMAGLAQLWRGGCIIRSTLLRTIKEAFQRDPLLSNLLLDPLIAETVGEAQVHWRNAVARMTRAGIASPAMSSALSYYDGFRTARGSANLLQAQRDYFGAHTYERTDEPRGTFFHTQWN